MLEAVRDVMEKLKLPINEQKTRCLRCPEEPLEFLGYRIGRNYRPSKASVRNIRRKVSEMTMKKNALIPTKDMVERLNWKLSGWASYYDLGQVSPAYRAIDYHTTGRLRRWLCCKHKVKTGKYVRFSDKKLWEDHGLMHLRPVTKSFPWAKA